MKYLKWDLKNIMLGKCAHAFRFGSEDFNVHLTMFRRKVRLGVKTQLGQHLISRDHRCCFPGSWEEVFDLYKRFNLALQDPPSIWRVTQHPKGLCMSLFDSLFTQPVMKETATVSLPISDEVNFQLTFGTNLKSSCGIVKGSLIAVSGSFYCFRLTKTSLPLLTLAWLLANDGYELARFSWVDESPVYLGGVTSFRSLTYERMCELWVRSDILSSMCYVPLVALSRKNLEGLKCFENIYGGFRKDVPGFVS